MAEPAHKKHELIEDVRIDRENRGSKLRFKRAKSPDPREGPWRVPRPMRVAIESLGEVMKLSGWATNQGTTWAYWLCTARNESLTSPPEIAVKFLRSCLRKILTSIEKIVIRHCRDSTAGRTVSQ